MGAFLVGKFMDCKYSEMRVEHPTSGACRYMQYCIKYKEYCLKQCEKDRNAKSKK